MRTNLENKSRLAALALSSTLLLGGTGYFFNENSKLNELTENQEVKIASLARINKSLSAEIPMLKNQLEQYKGKSKELDNLLVSANKDIVLKEKRIKVMISENSSLLEIKKEYLELKSLNEKYLVKIKTLEQSLRSGTEEIQALKSELASAKSRLSELESRNSQLESKVYIASALKSENITLTTEKVNNKGTYTRTRLKKADRMNISFDLVENKITAPGEKFIYVRIKDSKGNLIQNKESGKFINVDQNISLPYTQSHIMTYSNRSQKLSIPVNVSGDEMEKGNYTVEIFCDGRFAGMSNVKVK